MRVKHLRGTTQEWQEVNLSLIPEAGELVIEECEDGTIKCKIGTGQTRFSELPYIDDSIKDILLQEILKTKQEVTVDFETKLSNLAASLEAFDKQINGTPDSDFGPDSLPDSGGSGSSNTEKPIVEQLASLQSTINAINETKTGILAQAKAYSNSLNHKDTKYTAVPGGGLKLDATTNAFSIDDSLTFIFDCGGAQ